MKRFIVLTTLMLCGVLFFSSGTLFAQKKMKKQAMMMAAEDMKWEEMKGGVPGITFCTLWGNMGTGAYGAMVKLPPNMNNPLHTHSYDTKLVVVSGSFYVKEEGGVEKVFGPGSYLMEPGKVKHTSGTKEQGATLFQEGTGKFDFNMVEMPKENK
jgi:quercetin dioxygenase-like cupin family protein